jgi:group I intron endonuclease
VTAGVYCITNKTTNRCYIGGTRTIRKRWHEHKKQASESRHHSRAFQEDWDKYGAQDFEFKILLWCSPDNLRMYEQSCMSRFLSYYNVSPSADSQFGLKMSAGSRAKLSESAKRTKNRTGIPHTPESKAKISASRMGKGGGPRTPERCRNISKALATLSEAQVRDIRARRMAGETYTSIAKDYPVKWFTVADICNRRTYKWVT